MKRKEIEKYNRLKGQVVRSKPNTQSGFDLDILNYHLSKYTSSKFNSDIVGIARSLGEIIHETLSCASEHGLEMESIFDAINENYINFHNEESIERNSLNDDIKKALVHSINYDGSEYTPSKKICQIDVEVESYVTTVIDEVANYFDVTVNALCGPSREQPLAIARHIISYLCFERYFSYSQFGKVLTNIINRDRTTFIHGNKKVKEGMIYDKTVKLAVDEITEIVRKSLLQKNV